MTYRPTVRYPEVYKNYVDDVFKATKLDRNQIIRLALFIAAHSSEFNSILEKYKNSDVPLPYPAWSLSEEDCWKTQNYVKKVEEQPKVIKQINKAKIRYVFN